MRTYDDSGFGEAKSPVPHPAEHDSPSKLQALVASRAAEPEAVLALQRTAGNAAVVQLLADDHQDEAPQEQDGRSPVLDVVGSGGGQPLDPVTKATMERGLGADFSDVRVHTDGAAATSAKAVQAHAYTVGNNVVFQSGLYEPGTAGGQRMLAHELTHVIQQRSGPVDGSPAGGGIALSDPADRFEQAAEANADRFVSSGAGAADVSAAATPAAALQRSAEGHDDQAVQGMFVQRQSAPGEEEENKEEPVQGSFVQREGEEDKMEDEAAG